MTKKPKVKGTLIPIGGNEDKGAIDNEQYTLDFIEEGILSAVVRDSGGKKAQIVVIPTASSIPEEVGENYLEAFDTLGCKNVHVLNLTKKGQAEKKSYLKWIEQADCVMFSGGDQSKIASKIGNTAMHEVLMERFTNEKFVIAGTSAGAMCMSQEMIAGGSSTESFIKGAVRMRQGMGFMPDLIIDSHFIRRGRFGRVAEALAIFPNLMGVGLAEDTGLIIKDRNQFTVIGSGMVIVFDPANLKHNAHRELKKGTPMSMSNLTTHILSNGDRFSVDKRKIKVLPMDAPFITA